MRCQADTLFQKPYTTLRLRMVLQDEILPVNRPRSTTSQMHTSEQCYQNHKCICAARQIHCFKGHTLRYDYAWFFKTKVCLWIDHVLQLPTCTPENSATKNHKCICAARQIHCFKSHTLRYDYAWFFKTKFCLWIDHVVQLPRCTPVNSATKITNVYALPGRYIVSKAIHYATITHGSSRRNSACESTM